MFTWCAGVVGMTLWLTNVSIETAAQHLDMRPRTIERMIAAGTLTGFVDWEQVESKLLPARPPRS